MKYIKAYETLQEDMVRVHYGESTISTCEDMMKDIRDIFADIVDDGYTVIVGFTPMTYACRWDFPEMIVQISNGGKVLQEGGREEFDGCLLRLTSYLISQKWKYEAGFYNAHTQLGVRIFKEER